MASAPIFIKPQKETSYKVHIAVDFGTDGLGLAYAIGDEVYVHSKWIRNSEKYRDEVKPKTIILLDKHGGAECFGKEAKEIYMTLKSKKDHMLFERFKMALYEDAITNHGKNTHHGISIKTELTADNGCKYPAEFVFIEAFKYIQKESKRYLKKRKMKVKKEEIQWIVTVPAIWCDKSKDMMKQWIVKAGLVDAKDKTQCKIVYEPDSASLAIQVIQRKLKNAQNSGDDDDTKKEEALSFSKGEKYVLIDAGGGTVDVACHQIMGSFGVREVLPPSGGPWGSCKIDDEYKQTLDEIFGAELMREFRTKYPNVYMRAIDYFQRAKADFDASNERHNCRLPTDFIAWLDEKFEDNGEIQDSADIVANCVMAKSKLVELNDDVLEFHRNIWCYMFDQVMDPIQEHVETLLCDPIMMRNCKYLCLVGGLSCSPYFQHKMKSVFGEKSKYKLRLVIPERPILSVAYGAACFGITKHFIKARRVPKTYGIGAEYSITDALERGVSQSYIDQHKMWRRDKNEYRMILFYPMIRKGTDVWANQVFQNTFHRQGTATSCNMEILASTEVHPILYSSQDIVLKSTVQFEATDPPGAPFTIQWHLYDTTIKIICYLHNRPHDKTEMEITYE